MPFLRELGVGLDAYTGYSWYYSPHGTLASDYYGTVSDATYPSQPVQQSYGGELYVRYAVKPIYGVKVDVMFVFVDGDLILGYSLCLYDGQSYFYVFYWYIVELYLNLIVCY